MTPTLNQDERTKPARLVHGSEVRDLYDALGSIGIQLCYRHSKDMPEYKGTTTEGVELFEHEGRTLRVAPGQIIDDNGNVINSLSARLALFDHFIKRTPEERP